MPWLQKSLALRRATTRTAKKFCLVHWFSGLISFIGSALSIVAAAAAISTLLLGVSSCWGEILLVHARVSGRSPRILWCNELMMFSNFRESMCDPGCTVGRECKPRHTQHRTFFLESVDKSWQVLIYVVIQLLLMSRLFFLTREIDFLLVHRPYSS